jgi:SAM-dependent methyltransferase
VVFVTSALPARADMEHLRREAKTLLLLLQGADRTGLSRRDVHAPELPVSLSTAQLVVAREHGFGSWAQLKTVVRTLSGTSRRYDTIGRGYSAYRRADPRIAAAVHAALGDARTVVNVGAGTGSYEPLDRPVIPVEPSTEMAKQRDPSLPPAVIGVAESLPLVDDSADAVMAILTLHHWADQARGVAEMRRVARRRVVVLTIDVEAQADMWLFRDYAPELLERDRQDFPALDQIQEWLQAPTHVVPVPVPADCRDGFLLAFWSQPEAVLDADARAATSGFARLDDEREQEAVHCLARDLASGAWDRAHGHLRKEKERDVGLRLLVADLSGRARP